MLPEGTPNAVLQAPIWRLQPTHPLAPVVPNGRCDAAQERGEVRSAGNPNSSRVEELPGVGDLGLSHKDIHDARQVRDAEIGQTRHMRRALEGALDHGTAPVPSLPDAFTRRRALFGAVVLAAAPVAALAPLPAAAATPSPAEARLLALADAYEALERRCREHTAAHRHLRGRAFKIAEAEFDAIVERFLPIEEKMTATPADSLAGVLAKARLCQVPTARQCAQVDHVLSVVDDLHRLFGGRHA